MNVSNTKYSGKRIDNGKLHNGFTYCTVYDEDRLTEVYIICDVPGGTVDAYRVVPDTLIKVN